MAEREHVICQLPDAADDHEFQRKSFFSLVHARRHRIKMTKAESSSSESPATDVICVGPRVSSPIVFNVISLTDEPFTFGCAGFS